MEAQADAILTAQIIRAQRKHGSPRLWRAYRMPGSPDATDPSRHDATDPGRHEGRTPGSCNWRLPSTTECAWPDAGVANDHSDAKYRLSAGAIAW